MNEVDIKKLAALARIDVGEDELRTLSKEFEAILAYVGQLEKLQLPEGLTSDPLVKNVMRSDENPTEAGTWTKKLVEQFPGKEDDYLVVKQIISHD